MTKTLILVGITLAVLSGIIGYRSAAAGQNSRIQELEQENADLKEKLDNIQSLVTDAKSDLDDVESEAQSDESCEDTNAYSDATDVEDKLNDIESESDY
jgi:peptidoglycan hydrolase CwlO-like protein